MNLEDASSSPFVKAMLIGDSKAGKTTALASLVEAGYDLGILDMDCKIVPSYFEQTLRKKNPALLRKVSFEQLRDKYAANPGTFSNGQAAAMSVSLPVKPAKAYKAALRLTTKWSDETKPSEWGPDKVFVVDTLNLLSTAAFNEAYSLSDTTRDARQWYKAAQNAIENYLAGLWSSDFKTNVLVLSHITDIPLEVEYVKVAGQTQQQPVAGTSTKGFPTTIGQALSKHVAKYSNELWTVETRGFGPTEKRVIITGGHARMNLGTAALNSKELPADTGLATLFKTLKNL